MKFRFQCLAVTHTSGRVTVAPVSLPAYAVHAATLEQAREELTLALDDAISRSHPRHLHRFCQPGEASVLELSLPALEDAGALVLRTLQSATSGKHTEVRLTSDALRYWFSSSAKTLVSDSTALLVEHLKDRSPDALLRLRAEGQAALLELELEVKPLALSALRRRELTLDERPPPRGLDEEPEEAPKDDWVDDEPDHPGHQKAKQVPTPTLDRLGVKWHVLANEQAFAPTFERDVLVEQVLAHLAQKDAEPLVLVGASGVGKTAVLHEVARRLAAQRPVRSMYLLDGSRLIASSGGFGEWQEQTLDAFAEATEAKAVLHLGRLTDLLDAGRSAHSDDNVSQLITPALASREVVVLGELTPSEWARLRSRNQSFARLFAPLMIDEPDEATSKRVIARLSKHEAAARGIAVTTEALDEVRSLVRRFRPAGSAFGNAVSMLRRLLDGLDDKGRLGRTEVIAAFSIESGVPERFLRDDLPLSQADVRAFLEARVKGQPEAIERVSQIVSVIKANLSDPGRPVATLLFAGPTGVGKTELSKALAALVFGSTERLVRLDMGEYAGPDALLRLMGDGQDPGLLAGAVSRQPFSVVLLDEIEKAHSAIFDALLSVLGEGRLTDSRGRTVDFRSTVIVMTSNLGAQTHRPSVGFGGDSPGETRAHYLAEIRRFFRPELFNRIDDVVVFSSLGRTELSVIVNRELQKVARRPGFSRTGLELVTAADAAQALATWGHEPKYGARPLKRAIERRLVVPAAAHLATHPPSGPGRLEVSLQGEGLSFSVQPGATGSEAARVEILQVCEAAAELRAEVRAWQRAPLMHQVRDSLRMFERLSKQKSFWADHQLADEQSRRAGLARELEDAFAAVRSQVEAAEELAFESWATRTPRSAVEINTSLEAARREFEPLCERLFASSLPPIDAATLTLMPGKNANESAMWLVDGYRAWARSRGLRYELWWLLPIPPEQKAKHAPATHVWKEQGVWESAQAIALKVFGKAVPMLLSAEHGAHRISADGASYEVRVRFQPGAATPEVGEALERAMPTKEIRRIVPKRKTQEHGLLRDLRTATEHRVVNGQFELGPVLADWVRHIVFGSAESSWS